MNPVPLGLLRSEWTKLRSPRSNQVCAALVVLAMFGIAIALGARWGHQRGTLPDNFDATNVGLSGVDLALVIVGALGVLSISSEYATGMICTSLAAVPQRASMLAAKALVLAVATLVVSEVLAFGSFLVCQALLAHIYSGVSLSDPGVLTAVVGSGLFLTEVALVGLGLGAALRNTAGAIAALFTVLFALPAIIDLLPTSLRNDIIDYLPLNAASQILQTIHKQGALSPWTGLGVFTLYVLAALAAGFAVIATRDA